MRPSLINFCIISGYLRLKWCRLLEEFETIDKLEFFCRASTWEDWWWRLEFESILELKVEFNWLILLSTSCSLTTPFSILSMYLSRLFCFSTELYLFAAMFLIFYWNYGPKFVCFTLRNICCCEVDVEEKRATPPGLEEERDCWSYCVNGNLKL